MNTGRDSECIHSTLLHRRRRLLKGWQLGGA